MRSTIRLIIILVIAGSTGAQDFCGQQWARLDSEPAVNLLGEPGTWNGGFYPWEMVLPSAIRVLDTTKVYFPGYSAETEQFSIGLVQHCSTTGWQFADNPVFEPSDSDWDSTHVGLPSVLFDEGIYKMWYTGSRFAWFNDHESREHWRIGYATSSDGLHWTRHDTLVLDVGSPGTWDNRLLGAPCVLRDGDTLKMWYYGKDAPDGDCQIGYARSINGYEWEKYGNPVLSGGGPGTWDSRTVAPMYVFKSDDLFHLWYSGRTGAVTEVGYAYSVDGIHWTKDSTHNPLPRGAPESWDGLTASFPVMISDSDPRLLEMLYYARSDVPEQGLGTSLSLKGLVGGLSSESSYLSPGESDGIASTVFNGDTTDLQLMLEIETPQNETLETFPLFDDGLHQDGDLEDGIYANIFSAPADEGLFNLGLTVLFQGEEIVNYNRFDTFTTLGPVCVDTVHILYPYDDPLLPGNSIYFDLILVNLGTQTAVSDIVCSISLVDTFLMNTGYNVSSYDAIGPGESLAGSPYFGFAIRDEAPLGFPLSVDVSISVGDQQFWQDEIYMVGYVNTHCGGNTQPNNFKLHQNYPNPFNPLTTISYALPTTSDVTLTMYDVAGKLVTTLQRAHQPAGWYDIQWDATDDSGNPVSTGVYFCRLNAGDISKTIKMILLK